MGVFLRGRGRRLDGSVFLAITIRARQLSDDDDVELTEIRRRALHDNRLMQEVEIK